MKIIKKEMMIAMALTGSVRISDLTRDSIEPT